MKLTVSQKKTTPISKDLIGVFFEDINYGADGGIYAELIENRNFEFVDCYGDKGDYYTIFDGGYGWNAYPAEDSARLQVVCGSPVSDEILIIFALQQMRQVLVFPIRHIAELP